MPYPYVGTEVRRPDLEGVLEEFDLQASREGFIATRVMPVMNVEVDSGKYHYIPLEELLQNLESLERAPGAAYAETDFTWKEGSFSTQELGITVRIDDKMADRYKAFEMEAETAKFARDAVLRHIERAVATALHDTDTFSSDNVDVAWDVEESAKPITDVDALKEEMFKKNGLYPNKMIISHPTYRALLACAQVRDRWPDNKDKSQGALSASDLASVFGLDEILVAGGAYNSAPRGQTATIAHIWGADYAMLVRTMDPGGSPYRPGVGRLLHYSSDGSSIGGTIETYRDPDHRGEKLRCRIEATPKIYYPECGFLIGGIATAA